MKNKENWQPSKYVRVNGKLRASRNPKEVGVGSQLMADIIAAHFDTYIKDHTRGKLLDLGCGKVPLYETYKNYITENICVDWDISYHQNFYTDFNCDLNDPLPFSDNEFETILLSDVLSHIYNPEKLLREAKRVLTSGGKILISNPFYYWINEEPFDYYRYTEFYFRKIAEELKLNVILLKPLGGTPEILTDILGKRLIKRPRVGKYLAKKLQAFTFYFVNHTSLGKKISNTTSKSFPLGYFIILEKQ